MKKFNIKKIEKSWEVLIDLLDEIQNSDHPVEAKLLQFLRLRLLVEDYLSIINLKIKKFNIVKK